MTATDATGFDAIFSTGFFRYFLQILGGSSCWIAHKNWRKNKKIQWRASSGDGAPKLQISVPCRGRTRPEIGVSETGSAKTGSAIDVRIDDAGSILKFRIGFSLWFSTVASWVYSLVLEASRQSILNFRIGFLSSIGPCLDWTGLDTRMGALNRLHG